MSLKRAYAMGHSIIRSQIFFVECVDIPLFVASQLVRSHVGVQFFQRSRRPDRGGQDFKATCTEIAEMARGGADPSDIAERIADLSNHYDRYAPTDLAFIINAEALINMAHKRLCSKASPETRQVFRDICKAVKEVDPDLAECLVPMCIYRGGLCSEPSSCGYPLIFALEEDD